MKNYEVLILIARQLKGISPQKLKILSKIDSFNRELKNHEFLEFDNVKILNH